VSDETGMPASGDGVAPPTPLEETGVILFSTRSCEVCRVLKPKIRALLAQEFPRLPLHEIDCEQEPGQVHHFGVRTVPTAIVRFGGQETARRERVFSLGQLREDIDRPYRIYFAE
jgi:thioredoxin 1